MTKMVKSQVCYNKTCWSTKNTVLEEAEKREEEHFKEELDKRIEPHSHKKDNPIDKNNDINNNEKNEIKENIKDFSASYDGKLKVNIYNKKDKGTKTTYYLDETYLMTEKSPNIKKSYPDLQISHDHDLQEYEEFLIEQDPRGGLKISNLYKTTAGEFRKKGLIPIYDVLRFNRY